MTGEFLLMCLIKLMDDSDGVGTIRCDKPLIVIRCK